MTPEFDRQIAVARREQPREGYDATFDAQLPDGWTVGGGINGGFQLAVLGNALKQHLPERPDPISVSAYFLSAGRPGPATVDLDVRRRGGLVTAAADLRQPGGQSGGQSGGQQDATRITALATYGDLDRLPDDVATTATEPDLPAPEDCFSNQNSPEEIRKIAKLMDRFEMRFHPDHAGWAVGEPGRTGVISAWFRLVDGREPDPISLLMVCDALPPVTFDLGLPGWAPTLELTVHVRAKPAPGWLKVRHATRNLAGGMFEEDCEVWDSAGRLVAQSRQLARLPRPA